MQEEEKEEEEDSIVLMLFPPLLLQVTRRTHQHTDTGSIDRRKGRIVHNTYYTIYNRGGTLF